MWHTCIYINKNKNEIGCLITYLTAAVSFETIRFVITGGLTMMVVASHLIGDIFSGLCGDLLPK